MRRQALFDALKLLVGVEVALRAFRVFPGARATWERLLAASVVVATTFGFWFLPRDPSYGVLFAHQQQIIAATVWLFTVTSLVIVHYRIPIDPWHRAILLAFVPYLLVFTTAIAVMKNLGASVHPAMSLLDSAAYLAMIAYWAQTAWRHEAALDVSPATRRTLQLEGA
jgi:predicted ferric reductase